MGAMATTIREQQERVRDESRAAVVLADAGGDPLAAAVFARHEAAAWRRWAGQVGGPRASARLLLEYLRQAAELERAAVILERLNVELGYEPRRQRRQLPPVQPAGHLAF